MTTYIGGGTGTTTATIPTHAVGDLILIFAYRSGSATAPSLPAGYTSILTTSDSTNSVIVGYKIATATNDTSGTWTNASQIVALVYRASAGNQSYIGRYITNDGSSTTVNYPALTLYQGDGTSWVVGFAGMVGIAETLSTPPAGMTNREAITGAAVEAVGHDTNGGVTSWPSTNVLVGGSAAIWITAMVEVIDFPASGTHGAWDVTGGAYGGLYGDFNYSNNDKTVTSTVGGGSATANSTDFNPQGKYYVEITCTLLGNSSDFIGIANDNSGTYYVGLGSNGGWSGSGGGSGTIEGFTTGGIISIAVDLTNGLAWFAVNGGEWNNSATANPATGIGGLSFSVSATNFYAFANPDAVGAEYTLNTGTTAFAYTPPSGFSNWYGTSSYQPYVLMALFQGGRHS